MRYLCAVYFEPKALESLSALERAALDRDSMAYDEELRRSGHYLVSDALQPVSKARTVRVRKGKVSAIDGPFAETKEHLGGFILIEAKDMNEAIQLASGIPLAKLGSIEVRPSMEIAPPAER
ncbi:MAG: YciI family protein [Candidatus Binatus sp.]|uniref:YciI family protein n=1 Tax=Candidatus Binatus sp. TaxID=2811406 RepID=UPI002721A1B0|nr:YciI family protein [Candidatus Binatus sp.]MDO8434417.1 YciI family protein [Candidatus Binatus sp.]